MRNRGKRRTGLTTAGAWVGLGSGGRSNQGLVVRVCIDGRASFRQVQHVQRDWPIRRPELRLLQRDRALRTVPGVRQPERAEQLAQIALHVLRSLKLGETFMVTALTAESNNNVCPLCGDELTEDPSGKGFVRHKTNPDCPLERGERDQPSKKQPTQGERA